MSYNYTPTCRLRFVERMPTWVPIGATLQMARILQQWWEPTVGDRATGEVPPGQWRDVPVGLEDNG